MNATSKRPRAARPTTRRQAPTTKPFLRFHLSDALQAKTLAVLDALEQSPEPTEHRDALADIVVELTNAGLDAYFMQPLKRAKAGFVTERSASLGMAGARRVMGSIIGSIIGRMNEPQLRSVCASMRQFMR